MVWLKSKAHWEIQKEPVVGGWDSEARVRPTGFLLGQQRPAESSVSRHGTSSELWLRTAPHPCIFFH